MDIKAEEISKVIRDQIGSYAVDVDVAEVGSIISIGDGIARIHGVENAMAGEMLEFPHGVFGIALNLEEESVGAVLLGDFKEIKEGKGLRRELSAEVLEKLITLVGENGLLGVVLPQSVLDSTSAKRARNAALTECEVLEIAMLPGGLFESQAETAVLMLRKNKSRRSRSTTRASRPVTRRDSSRRSRTSTGTRRA